MSTSAGAASEMEWFAGIPGSFLLFRVNRRPWPNRNLFTPDLPPDVFEHFVRALAPGHEVVTGRRHQRTWRAGGLHRDPETKMLVGKLGWEPHGQEVVPRWSPAEKDWLAGQTSPAGGRVVPFGFDGETRLLTVLRESRSSPNTVAAVFERILRENEEELDEPTTEWSVEPVLDSADFLSWLETLDTVRVVSFTAKLPNPDPRSSYRDLGERLKARHVTTYTETLRSERDEGLVGVRDDTDIQQAIAMAEQGQAKLRGEGRRGDSVAQYSQTNRVARESVEEVPPTWNDAWDMIRHLLKGSLRRFIDDDEAAA